MAKQGDILPYLRLKLNIDQPSLEECWADGYDVAQKEGHEDANPFHEDSMEYQHWNQGWWAGFYGEERWYKEHELCDSANHYRKQVSQFSMAVNEPDYGTQNYRDWAGKFAKIAGAIAATIVAVELFELSV